MKLYSKNVIVDGDVTRKIYYSATGIVSDSDPAVIYKDADGDRITCVPDDVYLDDGKSGIIRKSDGKKVLVCSNETTVIIPFGGEIEPKVVKKIEVTTLPTKTIYIVGEEFNEAGMVVTCTYKDGDKKELAAGVATVTAPDMTTAGKKEVVVSFSEKTTSFYITVNAAE